MYEKAGHFETFLCANRMRLSDQSEFIFITTGAKLHLPTGPRLGSQPAWRALQYSPRANLILYVDVLCAGLLAFGLSSRGGPGAIAYPVAVCVERGAPEALAVVDVE